MWRWPAARGTPKIMPTDAHAATAKGAGQSDLGGDDAKLAAQVMGEFSHRCLRVAMEDCVALADAAQARLRVAERLNLKGKPMAPEQLW